MLLARARLIRALGRGGQGGAMASVYSRRSFISRVALLGCALPLTGYAHRFQSRRVRRIRFLIGTAPTLIGAFEEELRRLG
jgi:hypothetical protein